MKRYKTISVDRIRQLVNDKNRLSTCPADVRKGWNDLLEIILGATNNYQGFGYLKASEVPADQLPGMSGNHPDFIFPDESRRIYL